MQIVKKFRKNLDEQFALITKLIFMLIYLGKNHLLLIILHIVPTRFVLVKLIKSNSSTTGFKENLC